MVPRDRQPVLCVENDGRGGLLILGGVQMRVAIDQLDVALARPDQNFAQVAADVKEAAKAGADVIVIPEMWNTGYALDQLGGLSRP